MFYAKDFDDTITIPVLLSHTECHTVIRHTECHTESHTVIRHIFDHEQQFAQ